MSYRAGVRASERRDPRVEQPGVLLGPAPSLAGEAPHERGGLAIPESSIARGLIGSGIFAGGLYAYTVVQGFADPKRTLAGAWDAAIPFVPELVFVYFLFFPFVVMTTFVATPREWLRAIVASSLSTTVGVACFLALPASMQRPEASALGVSLAGDLLRWLHTIDAAHNTFPSLHVAVTWIACIALRHSAVFRPAIVVAVAISASTMLVKQHTLLDVAGGVVLAAATLALAGRWRWIEWTGSSPS